MMLIVESSNSEAFSVLLLCVGTELQVEVLFGCFIVYTSIIWSTFGLLVGTKTPAINLSRHIQSWWTVDIVPAFSSCGILLCI
jgi:hypothetical protein